MFHGLADRMPAYATLPDGRACILTARDFERTILWARRHYRIVRLEELSEPRGDRPRLLLTFDDGLASVHDLGVPILARHNVSALVFVTPGWTDLGRPPDIFRLERALWESPPAVLEVTLDEASRTFAIGGARQRVAAAVAGVWGWMFERRAPPLRLRASQVRLDGIAWEPDAEQDDRHFWHPASWEELRADVASGRIEIGSHMMDHEPLAWMDEASQEVQLSMSRKVLEDRTGARVRACSYPHGMSSELTHRLAARHYEWGFTNTSRALRTQEARDALPRVNVPGDDPESIRWRLRSPEALARIAAGIRSRFVQVLRA